MVLFIARTSQFLPPPRHSERSTKYFAAYMGRYLTTAAAAILLLPGCCECFLLGLPHARASSTLWSSRLNPGQRRRQPVSRVLASSSGEAVRRPRAGGARGGERVHQCCSVSRAVTLVKFQHFFVNLVSPAKLRCSLHSLPVPFLGVSVVSVCRPVPYVHRMPPQQCRYGLFLVHRRTSCYL